MTDTSTLRLKLMLDGMAQVEAGFKQVTNAVSNFGAIAKAAALAFVGYAGLKGLSDTAKDVLELGHSLTILKNTLGASIPNLMATQKLLKEHGESAESVGVMYGHMQNAIKTALEDGGKAEATITDLGLSVEALAKMDAGEQFRTIGEAIAKMPNSMERTAAAVALFGKQGYAIRNVFSSVDQFNKAFETQSPFVNVMARSSEMFSQITVNMERFAANGKKFMAGVLDQITPIFSEFVAQLGKIDLTEVGQKFGAFGVVVIQSIRDGKFPEMLGLLVEAGFQLGAMGARRVFDGLVAFLESEFMGQILVALANGIMTFGVKLAEVLGEILKYPIIYTGTLFDWLYDQAREKFSRLGNFLKEIFGTAINWWAENLESFINGAIKAFNKIRDVLPGLSSSPVGPVNLGRVGTSSDAVTPAKSFGQSYGDMSKAADSIGKDIGDYLDRSLKASREILKFAGGVTAADNANAPALQRLLALVDEQLKKRAAMVDTSDKQAAADNNVVYLAKLKRDLIEAERQARERLVVLEDKQSKIDTDYTLTTAEKYAKKKDILVQQRQELENIVALLKRRADLEQDPNRQEQILGQIPGAEKGVVAKGHEIDAMGPNPESFVQNFRAAIASLLSEWGTMAEQMANSFKTVMNTAVSSVSSGITGLIMRTQTWGQALRQIETSIMTSIIQSIVEMGVKWFVTHVFMQGIATAFSAFMNLLHSKDTAQVISREASKTPLLATNAALSSVSSYGAAILAIGALALMVASFAGGFSDGGYTGSGGKYEPAGVVHKGEVVWSQADIARAGGVANVEAMRVGGLAALDRMSVDVPSSSMDNASAFAQPLTVGAPNVNVQGHSMTIIQVQDDKELKRAIEKHSGSIIKIVKGNKNEIGIPS